MEASARRSRLSADEHSHEIALVSTKTVTGLEWRLRIGDELDGRFCPEVGVFTEADAEPADVFPKVMRRATFGGEA